ncbi:hypothetical protein SAY86_003707 [Trapa natans]|uniref:NAC domain-containing protein n=1 Tax=Trapa natans TaxID=22666 RepID=A0AAN7MX50_TRANT|nr:hypothetical protein SAY86_003707 [Trapa natans]
MESTDSSAGTPQQPQLPPGFRFHPTDEELIVHYLKKKASSSPLPVSIIAEVDIYKFDPWELPAKATYGEQEWYFFSPRDRKYPNGARPNRAATSGYWKATGTDKPVLAGGSTHKVGVKKALVFYSGKPPKGIKTNWIMHEYRLVDNNNSKPQGFDLGNKKNSLRLDDWVLCRIYKKNSSSHRPVDHDKDESSMDEILESMPPPPLAVGGPQGLRFHGLPRPITSTSYCPIFDTDQATFESMMGSNGNGTGCLGAIQSLPLKQTLPSLYWYDKDMATETSLGKRPFMDLSCDSAVERLPEGDNSGSISCLLCQIPAAANTSLQQQAQPEGLGSIRGNVLRQLYQLQGLNWYT